MDAYVSRAGKAAFAAECAERLREEGIEPCPGVAHGKKIAQSFWGYSWCRNIESWQDYESRLPAGRSLLRAGAVIHLAVEENLVDSYVADGEMYHLRIPIEPPDPERLDALRMRCAGSISSLMALIAGDFSEEILNVLTDPANGLFPRSNELKFICNCLDDSCLCRHAAAALYAVGARLDDEPQLFFRMRGIRPESFFTAAPVAEALTQSAAPELDSAELSGIFGIDLADDEQKS